MALLMLLDLFSDEGVVHEEDVLQLKIYLDEEEVSIEGSMVSSSIPVCMRLIDWRKSIACSNCLVTSLTTVRGNRL